MRVFVDPAFDAGAWPGALAGRAASSGEMWLGGRGLLELLELRLGLSAHIAGESSRIVELARCLRLADGFWSRSCEADALGTAERMLEWRDVLSLEGWCGEGGGRLAALHGVSASLPDGAAERWARVLGFLEQRRPRLDVALVEVAAREEWPSLVQQVFSALEETGADVTPGRLARAEAPSGNLRLVHGDQAAVDPHDESLTLLRTEAPRVAADEVASFLAAQSDWRDTVIIGADPILDDALGRYGLPTGAVGYAARSSPVLDVLLLACELLWSPCDPRRALDLLLLPCSPIGPQTARLLAGALHEYAAVGSPDWIAARDKALEQIVDPARRNAEGAWIARLFTARATRDGGVKTADVVGLAIAVERWMTDPAAALSASEAGASGVVEAFSRLVERLGSTTLSKTELLQLFSFAAAGLIEGSRHVAQAGLGFASSPGAVTAPCHRVIWWNFSTTRPRNPLSLLRRSERDALGSLGFRLPAGAQLARWASQRARRGLVCAESELILVCPERSATGEPNGVHPLWDEVSARASNAGAVATLVTKTLRGTRARVTPLALRLPSPRRLWSVAPELLSSREYESASSIGTLVGCSFRYALSYVGRVGGGIVAPLSIEPRTLGIMAHRLLEEFGLQGGFAHPGLMGDLFDARAPFLNALLFLPGHDDERAQARRFVVRAAEVLGRAMLARSLSVEGSEVAVEGNLDGHALRGAVDLLLKDPAGRRGVLDFKWGGAGARRRELAVGASHQLALYAHLVQPSSPDDVALGYLILNEGIILSPASAYFDGAELVESRKASRVWSAVKTSVDLRRAELGRGSVEAPANELGDDERVPERAAVADNGRFVYPPGCEYCAHGTLCGLSWRGSR